MFEIKKILVLDGVSSVCENILKQNGFEVTIGAKMQNEELVKELKKYDAVIVRSATKITKDVLEQTNLKVVGRAGTGVDNIDVKAATASGVLVMNTPGGNTLSAAEHTCALICSLSREIPLACSSLKEGKWDRKKFMGNELYGKTLAIIGLGRIGQEVAHRMKGFGMTAIGFDPLVTPETAASFGVQWVALEQLWPRADYITVHVPLIPQTRNLVGEEALAACKPTVRILNVARGGVVDEKALLTALNKGLVAGAAFDVFEQEPPTNKELVGHPKVIVTPHLGANTHEAQTRVAEEIAEQFVQMSNGGEIIGAVNAPQLNKGRDAPKGWDKLAAALGKMARILGEGGLKISIQIRGLDADKIIYLFKQYVSLGYLDSLNGGSRVNLISASSLSSQIGLDISENSSQTNGEAYTCASVVVTTNTGKLLKFEGRVIDGIPILSQMDGADFKHGVVLDGNVIFVLSGSPGKFLSQLYGEEEVKDRPVNVISVSNGQNGNSWVALNVQEFQCLKSVLVGTESKHFCMSFI